MTFIKFVILLLSLPFLCYSQTEVTLNKTGVEFSKKGNYKKAKPYYQKAIALNPDYAEPYANLGLIYKIKEDLDSAIILFEKAFKIDSTFTDAYYAYMYLGQCYSDKNQFAQAINAFNHSLALYPTNYSLYFDRGYAHAMLKNYQNVKEDFEIYLAHYPNDKMAKINLANVERFLGNIDYSLQQHNKLIKIYPDEYILHNNRAEVYLELKKYDLALKDIDIAISLKHQYAIGHFIKSKIYLAMGDTENACKNYKLAIKYGVELDEEPEKATLETQCK